jgi:hypothetical protein
MWSEGPGIRKCCAYFVTGLEKRGALGAETFLLSFEADNN